MIFLKNKNIALFPQILPIEKQKNGKAVLAFRCKQVHTGNKKPARVYLADLEGLVESEGAFVIAERASLLAEAERQHRKGGSDGKAVLAFRCKQVHTGQKNSREYILADLEGLVESEDAFVIAKRASSLAEVERQHRKGGSDGKAVLAFRCKQVHKRQQKNTLRVFVW